MTPSPRHSHRPCHDVEHGGNRENDEYDWNTMASERAREVMSQRFGIQVPELRTAPLGSGYSSSNSIGGGVDVATSTQQLIGHEQMDSPPLTRQTTPTTTTTMSGNQSTSTSSSRSGYTSPTSNNLETVTDNIERILQEMPAHIREAASRRPDLVRSLLVQKKKQMRNIIPIDSSAVSYHTSQEAMELRSDSRSDVQRGGKRQGLAESHTISGGIVNPDRVGHSINRSRQPPDNRIVAPIVQDLSDDTGDETVGLLIRRRR